MIYDRLQLTLPDFSAQDVCVVLLEVLEDGLYSPNLAIQEFLPILVLAHLNIVSHKVVLDQLCHFTIYCCCLLYG
jgi:hypothetical protein